MASGMSMLTALLIAPYPSAAFLLCSTTRHPLFRDVVGARSEGTVARRLNAAVVRLAREEGQVESQGAIFEALLAGDAEWVRNYVKTGGDCSVQDSSGDTPLMLAVENEMGSVVTLLANEGGADVNRASASSGETPLHIAAYYGYAPLAQTLVEQCGASPDSRTKKGDTPLSLACFWGNAETVKCLLHAGADPDVTNHAGQRPGDEFDAVFVPEDSPVAEDAGQSPGRSSPRLEIRAMLEEARTARKAVKEATAAAAAEGR